jgi:hypothetical protein
MIMMLIQYKHTTIYIYQRAPSASAVTVGSIGQSYLNDFCASPRNSAIGRNVEGISDDKKVKNSWFVSMIVINN